MVSIGSLHSPVVVASFLLGGVTAGSLVRISPFSGSGAAASALDLALLLAAAIASFELVRRKELRRFLGAVLTDPVWRWSAAFLGVAALSLALRLGTYSPEQLAIAASYLIRLKLIFFLGWFVWSRAPRFRDPVLKTFTAAATALIAFGALQLWLVSDFRFATRIGWDPHIDRLFSTFLDPNFFGVFAVLAMAVALGRYLAKPTRNKWLYLGLFVVSWIALFFAYSRSAWVAGLIAIPLLAAKRSLWLSAAIAAVFIGVLLLPNRLGDRFESTRGLTDASAFSGSKYRCQDEPERCDPSGSARFYSLKEGFELVQAEPVLGVGYNAYGFAREQLGETSAKSLRGHSANGSDSSLLNVWATTGIFGLLAFLAFLGSLGWRLRKRATGNRPEAWLAWSMFSFTVAWVAASFLNNALFYPQILVPWILLVAILDHAGRRT